MLLQWPLRALAAARGRSQQAAALFSVAGRGGAGAAEAAAQRLAAGGDGGGKQDRANAWPGLPGCAPGRPAGRSALAAAGSGERGRQQARTALCRVSRAVVAEGERAGRPSEGAQRVVEE